MIFYSFEWNAKLLTLGLADSMNQNVDHLDHHHTAIADKGLKMKIKRKGVGSGKGEKAKKNAATNKGTTNGADVATKKEKNLLNKTHNANKKSDKKTDIVKSKLCDDGLNGPDTDCETSSVYGERSPRLEDISPGSSSLISRVPSGNDAWGNLKRRVSDEGASDVGTGHVQGTGKHDDPYDFNVKTNDISQAPTTSYQNAKKQKTTKVGLISKSIFL